MNKQEIEKQAQKAFDKKISIIKRIGETSDKMIHSAGMYALEQVNTHGNTNPMNRLVSALGKSMRKEALILWFVDYGKVQRNNEDKTLSYSKNKVLKFSFDTNRPSPNGTEVSGADALVFAEEMPFYDYSKEKVPASVYDVNKGILSLIRNAQAAVKNGKKTEHLENLSKIKEMFPEIAALAA